MCLKQSLLCPILFKTAYICALNVKWSSVVDIMNVLLFFAKKLPTFGSIYRLTFVWINTITVSMKKL